MIHKVSNLHLLLTMPNYLKTNILLKVIIVFFLSLIFFSSHVKAISYSGDSLYRHVLKLDLAASYYTFFDNKKQLRIGVEYEKKVTAFAFLSCYLDIGMYDNYKFIKYYDFFGQNQDMYFLEQDVMTKGFHIMPGYNYSILKIRKVPRLKFFAGGVLDASFYQKKINYFNSQTLDKSDKKVYQYKTGIGPSLGVHYKLGTHIIAEAKTFLGVKILNIISDKNAHIIKSLNAQWTDTQNHFWWVTNLKIGYAF